MSAAMELARAKFHRWLSLSFRIMAWRTLNSTRLLLLTGVILASPHGDQDGSARADCLQYEVQLIQAPHCGIFGQLPTIGFDINDAGSVCGYYTNCSLRDRAFGWFDGPSLITVSFPFAISDSHGLALNNGGQIVGWFSQTSGGSRRAFVSNNGQAINIGTLPNGGESEAHGINSNGVVVGYANVPSALHAFRWERGVMSDLNLPIGPSNQANDINDVGQICGWMGVAPGLPFIAKPYIWIDGNTVELPLPPGSVTGQALAINNRGEACGVYNVSAENPNGWLSGAALWSGNQVIDLGLLPQYDHTAPRDINDDSVIVGHCTPRDGFTKAFVWRDGVITALDDLIVTPGGWTVTVAYGINSLGQIVGIGGDTKGNGGTLILTPIPGRVGDANCDDLVNIDDLLAVIREWGPAIPTSTADFNDDGDVDMDDLLAVLEQWG